MNAIRRIERYGVCVYSSREFNVLEDEKRSKRLSDFGYSTEGQGWSVPWDFWDYREDECVKFCLYPHDNGGYESTFFLSIEFIDSATDSELLERLELECIQARIAGPRRG